MNLINKKIDTHHCEDEPIRIPGLIQPGVILISYGVNDKRITHISNNFSDSSKTPKELINKPISTLLPAPLLDKLEAHFKESNNYFTSIAEPIFSKKHSVIAHQLHDLVILEVEDRESDIPTNENLFSGYNKIISELAKEISLTIAFDIIAENVKLISGFDRVMIYRFDDDWNGEVIAEAKEESLEPFLHLHYPHTDIPSQARELYLKNWLRTIPDVNYKPVEITPYSGPDSENPLDLGMAAYRSVSPIHIEYLKNMGVGATMVSSIIIEDKLWGLIACHHQKPIFIDVSTRSTMEMLSKIVSQFIRFKREKSEYDDEMIRNTHLKKINDKIVSEWSLFEGLFTSGEDLLQLMKADGVVVQSPNKTVRLGEIPTEEELDIIHSKVKKHKKSAWHTYAIGKSFEDIQWSSDIVGLYFLALSPTLDTYIIWFRHAVTKTVNWAGNPHKRKYTPEDRLSPRKSFDSWSEQMKNEAKPWTNTDMKCIQNLEGCVKDFAFLSIEKMEQQVKSKTKELFDAIEQLTSAKELADKTSKLRKEFLANMSHEVRTPLNSMLGLTQMIKARTNEPRTAEWSSLILESSNRLLETVSSILNAAMAESKSETFDNQIFDLTKLLRSNLEVHRPLIENKNLKLILDIKDNLVCYADKQKLNQTLNNIVSNALKFTETGSITISASQYSAIRPEVVIKIEDTGIGMSENYLKQIFQPFSQEKGDLKRAQEGSGLGLYISKNYIDLMGGSIEIASTKNKGTVFEIVLPNTTNEN